MAINSIEVEVTSQVLGGCVSPAFNHHLVRRRIQELFYPILKVNSEDS